MRKAFIALKQHATVFDTPAYRRYKKAQKFVGLWPYMPTPLRLFIGLLQFIFSSPMKYFQIKYFIEYQNAEPIDLMEAIVFFAIITYLYLMRLIFEFEGQKIRRYFEIVRKDYESSTSEEYMMMYQVQLRGTALLKTVERFVYASIALACFDMLRPVVLDILYPLEESRPRTYIYKTGLNVVMQDHQNLLLSYYILGSLFGVMYMVAYASFMCCGILHVYARFSLVRHYVLAIGKVDTEECIQRDIKKCMEMYRGAMRCLDILSDVLVPAMYPTLLCNLVTAVLFVYIVTLSKENIWAVADFIIMMVGGFFINFSLCWWGQSLIDEHEKLTLACYEVPWYNWSTKNRKSLHLLQGSCSKHVSFKVPGLSWDVSAASFLTFVNITYSSLTFLWSMKT